MGGNNLNKRGYDQMNDEWGGISNSGITNNSGESPNLISQSTISMSNDNSGNSGGNRIPIETIGGNNIINGATMLNLSNNTTPTTSSLSISTLSNNISNNMNSSNNINNNNNNINNNINSSSNNINNLSNGDQIINSNFGQNKDEINNTSSSNLILSNISTASTTTKTRGRGERKRTKFPDEEVKVLCDLVVLFGKDVRTILTFKPFKDGKYSERQIYDKVRALKKGGLVPSHPDSETIKKAKLELGIAENVDTDSLRSGKKGRLSSVVLASHSDSEYSSSEHEDDDPSGLISANTSTTSLIGSNILSNSSNNINTSLSLSASQSPQSPQSNISSTNLINNNNGTSTPGPSRRPSSARLINRRSLGTLQENAQNLINYDSKSTNTSQVFPILSQTNLTNSINSSTNNINNLSNSINNSNIISHSTTTSTIITPNRTRERDKLSALEKARIDKASDKVEKRIQTREKPAKVYKKETYIDSDTEFDDEDDEDDSNTTTIGKENSFLQFDYYSTNHNYSLKNNKTFSNPSSISSTSLTPTTTTTTTTTTTQPIPINCRLNLAKNNNNSKTNPFINTSNNNLISNNLNISSSTLNTYASSILNGHSLVNPNKNSFFKYETEKNLLIFYPFFTKSLPVNTFVFEKELLILTIEMPNVFDWLSSNVDKSPIISETNITVEFPHPGKNYGPPRKINKLPDGVNGVAFIFEKIKQGNVDLDLSSL
ncbi:hypothetical protein DICPUDRAFT_100117 [Dictyostelium purpureum]|uniref:Uncharacterized protein n=1 Tax=Dictyostelium purpureum TaxID=5786 RepID=F1A5N5_DICPU|nr:uncharacterized protein DICPUDRAFT_100117 [Dictyostelium purpureum]EGC28493.1 hypothetical protein DICPUDRAFT_100117 [Dictyostelium purpureum]|eukprot:XP_003294979.1 hypothetical protein DICPUDRAFT_100117 [Dictyostelium purpureum]